MRCSGFYRRKYAVEDIGHVLMSLTYFDDAEAEDTPEMLWDADWAEVKRTIESWVRDLVPRPSTNRSRRGPIR
jgi:hypothetical protein